MSDCRKSGGDCQAVIDKWKKVSDEQSATVDEWLKDDPLTAVGWDKEVAEGGYDMTQRPGWLGNIGAEVMTSDEAKAYVQQWNGQDLAKIDVNSSEWMKYAVLCQIRRIRLFTRRALRRAAAWVVTGWAKSSSGTVK